MCSSEMYSVDPGARMLTESRVFRGGDSVVDTCRSKYFWKGRSSGHAAQDVSVEPLGCAVWLAGGQ